MFEVVIPNLVAVREIWSAGEGGSWVGEVCVVTMSRLSLGLVLNRHSFFFLSAKESWEGGRKVAFFCPSLP